ncbi:MAG: 3-deoxy-8-phosphooctulonate synthase [Acidobacteria bacterium]|nr:MAG: 3-deoxy-8-phosphooctulonate synthase [Acidobacteriota bacterium]
MKSSTRSQQFSIGNIRVGGENSLFLIAGPCVIESPDHCQFMARRLKVITLRLQVPFIFKASFDKANRTSLSSYRGPGMKEGLSILKSVREDLGIPVLTDVHETGQIEPAAQSVDCLQIPAFLSRQTDLLLAAGKSGCAVNIKKGQFLAPWDMQHAVSKVASTGCQKILVTERGTSFGYNNLVVDMRSLVLLRTLNVPVVYDVTHSLQLPGGQGTASGGQPQFIEPLARAGVAAGVDGLFMEVHDNPAAALSDGPNALPLDRLEALLKQLVQINAIVQNDQRPNH